MKVLIYHCNIGVAEVIALQALFLDEFSETKWNYLLQTVANGSPDEFIGTAGYLVIYLASLT